MVKLKRYMRIISEFGQINKIEKIKYTKIKFVKELIKNYGKLKNF